MKPWKRDFFLGAIIFRFDLSFWGSIHETNMSHLNKNMILNSVWAGVRDMFVPRKVCLKVCLGGIFGLFRCCYLVQPKDVNTGGVWWSLSNGTLPETNIGPENELVGR